jgi:hypothetical protein
MAPCRLMFAFYNLQIIAILIIIVIIDTYQESFDNCSLCEKINFLSNEKSSEAFTHKGIIIIILYHDLKQLFRLGSEIVIHLAQ